jgi:hypothetical protein
MAVEEGIVEAWIDTCDNASATLVAGNLPMSSAVMASTMASALRLVSIDACRLARMPVTVTPTRLVTFLASASLACAVVAGGVVPEVSCAEAFADADAGALVADGVLAGVPSAANAAADMHRLVMMLAASNVLR